MQKRARQRKRPKILCLYCGVETNDVGGSGCRQRGIMGYGICDGCLRWLVEMRWKSFGLALTRLMQSRG